MQYSNSKTPALSYIIICINFSANSIIICHNLLAITITLVYGCTMVYLTEVLLYTWYTITQWYTNDGIRILSGIPY